MTTDYNQHGVARRYQQAKQQTWRSRVETYTFLRRIGDLTGKSVADAACGEGHFTRRLKQGGASKVVGFDISERMVELARAQEAEDPLGIEYRVHDARAIGPQQHFDLLVSAWLLVYAHDRTELATMCQGLARWLRPGGRFVMFTTNPDVYSYEPPADYRPYGFEIQLADRVDEGAPILWRIHLDGSTLDIENYYLPISAYEHAFRDAGFEDFAVHPLELSPDEDDADFWGEFLDCPPAIVMECVKR